MAATDEAAKKVEAVLASTEGVQTYQVTLGSGGGIFGIGGGGANQATYSVTIADGIDVIAMQDTLRRTLGALPDAGAIKVEAGGRGGGFSATQIQVIVQADDAEALATATEQVRAAVAGTPEIAEVTTDLTNSAPANRRDGEPRGRCRGRTHRGRRRSDRGRGLPGSTRWASSPWTALRRTWCCAWVQRHRHSDAGQGAAGADRDRSGAAEPDRECVPSGRSGAGEPHRRQPQRHRERDRDRVEHRSHLRRAHDTAVGAHAAGRRFVHASVASAPTSPTPSATSGWRCSPRSRSCSW